MEMKDFEDLCRVFVSPWKRNMQKFWERVKPFLARKVKQRGSCSEIDTSAIITIIVILL